MPIWPTFINASVSANYSGDYSCFYQGRLYRWRLLRRFLRCSTSSRFSFRLCTSSRFISWTRSTIFTGKRLSSFYEDDVPRDFSGHWEDALWSSGGSLIWPQIGVIAVDKIFDLHMASITIVTRETVICHSLRPAWQDIYVTPSESFAQFSSWLTGGWPFYYTSMVPPWSRYIRVSFMTCYLPVILRYIEAVLRVSTNVFRSRLRCGLRNWQVLDSRFRVTTRLPFRWCAQVVHVTSSCCVAWDNFGLHQLAMI